MNGKNKNTITLLFSLLLGLALILGGCSSSDGEAPGRDDGSGDVNSGRLPRADERGTDADPNDPSARVDTPPEPDNLMNPEKRTDHRNRAALMRESRDLRSDNQRTNDTLARVDTSTGVSRAGPNASVQPGSESGARLADKAKGKKAGIRMADPAKGETVVVRKRWSRIRRAPRENSRSLALAYGNDSFQVVSRKGKWVQVRFGRKNRRKGWIPLSALTR